MDTSGREVAEQVRNSHGATWYLKPQSVGGLAIVLKRFPQVDTTKPSGRTYVLVHGLGVSSTYFEFLAAELAHTGAVLLIDLPGFGDAPVPKRDMPTAMHGTVLGAVLREAGIENPVLVGHSMGCQVVTSLDVQGAVGVHTLVLLSPVSNMERRTRHQQLWDLFKDSLVETWRAKVNAVREYFLRGRMRYYLRQLTYMLEYPIEDRMPLLDAHTLIVTGDKDPIVPVAWAQSLADAAPHAALRVVPGAHVVMYSAPKQLAAYIAEHAQ
jgi:pimeloyl-ACP methyl ester carboxylesterase